MTENTNQLGSDILIELQQALDRQEARSYRLGYKTAVKDITEAIIVALRAFGVNVKVKETDEDASSAPNESQMFDLPAAPVTYSAKYDDVILQDLSEKGEMLVRTQRALKRAKIITIEDLRRYSETELLEITNFGPFALKDAKKILNVRGLNLRNS